MALHYEIDSMLNIEADPSLDLQIQGTVATDEHDLVLFGVVNFISGTFKQKSDDQDDIVSSVTVHESKLNSAAVFLAAAGDLVTSSTAYGQAVGKATHYFAAGAVKSANDKDDNVIDISDLSEGAESLIPMFNLEARTDSIDADKSSIKRNGSSVGDGLFQAITAALFKKIGKNAALNNDQTLIDSLNTKFYSQLANQMDEDDASYEDSKMYKRYLQAGRYTSQTAIQGADLNEQTYDLNSMLVNMKVKISGNVTDSDTDMNATIVNTAFGNVGTDETRVNSDGSYEITAFVQLRNDTRF